MFACIHGAGPLLECASAFSPKVEVTSADTVVLDIRGLERLFGAPREIAEAIAKRAEEMGLKVSVGVARNPEAAVYTARGIAGVTIIQPGEESSFLAGLPLEVLDPPPELLKTLKLWGLRCFRDLVALPESGLSQRLGPEGLRLQKLARGVGDRHLVTSDPPEGFEASMELEHPVSLLEPLCCILSRLLQEICRRLEAHGLATNELRRRLYLSNKTEHMRTLRLPFPTRDHSSCWKLLQLDLESHPPQAPIVGVRLGVEPVEPRAVQHELFLPPSPEPEKLELTLMRIANLVGEGNVGAAQLLDTHRPEAFRIRRFHPERRIGIPACPPRLVLRIFRPALRAAVHTAGRHPIRVVARGVRGEVVSRAGPWRTSGDWWAPNAWARDEWDVALNNGALYRIYWDRRSEAWFVEGLYD